jgi:hypothetical protein
VEVVMWISFKSLTALVVVTRTRLLVASACRARMAPGRPTGSPLD